MQQMGVTLDPMRTGSEAKSLEAELRALVVGQDEGIERIVNVYQTYLSGLMSLGRPLGDFPFLGPTGSGKTRTVEATAESLARNPRADVFLPTAGVPELLLGSVYLSKVRENGQ
jgi:ATP-dependent Clp protease ATP-binding subunit ClpA